MHFQLVNCSQTKFVAIFLVLLFLGIFGTTNCCLIVFSHQLVSRYNGMKR